MGLCLHLRPQRLRSSGGGRVPAVLPNAERSSRRRGTEGLQTHEGRRTGSLQALPAGRHAPGQPHQRRRPIHPVHHRSERLHGPAQRPEDVRPHAGRHDVGPLLVQKQLCAAPVPGDDQPSGQEPANLPHHGQPRQRLHDHVRLRRGRQVRGLHRPDLLLVQHRSGALRRHGQYRLQRIRRNRLAQLRQEALQRSGLPRIWRTSTSRRL